MGTWSAPLTDAFFEPPSNDYLNWRAGFVIPRATLTQTPGPPATHLEAAGRDANHPYYPSWHGCLTESEVVLVLAFLGTSQHPSLTESALVPT